MSPEKERMLRGELYNPLDPELASERARARKLLKAFNDSPDEPAKERYALLKALIPDARDGVWIQPPFYCDYGSNISIGKGTFLNFNCVILDVMRVRIGSFAMFGP